VAIALEKGFTDTPRWSVTTKKHSYNPITYSNHLSMKSFFVCLQFFIATVAFSQTSNVNWTNLVNATASGNTLTKTGSNGWNAGGSSTNVLAANTNGYVEISVSQDNTHRFFGLTQSDDVVLKILISLYFYYLINLFVFMKRVLIKEVMEGMLLVIKFE